MKIEHVNVYPRGVGRNGGWASLVTGQLVDHGPDLSLHVKNRVDAYAIVEMVTPIQTEEERNSGGKRVEHLDRAKVDYRSFEPDWLQVKLIVEEEHEGVLQRLSTALLYRDGYLDARLIRWALDPDTQHPCAIKVIERLEKKVAELEILAALKR